MYMRALGVAVGVMTGAGPSSHLHIENDGQSFGRIAGVVVARLIFEIAVNRVCAGCGLRRSNDPAGNHHIARINTELFIRVKGESHKLSRWILHAADDNVRGQGEVNYRGDQLRHGRLVGIDVEAWLDMKDKAYRSRAGGADDNRAERLKGDFFSRNTKLLRGHSSAAKGEQKQK